MDGCRATEPFVRTPTVTRTNVRHTETDSMNPETRSYNSRHETPIIIIDGGSPNPLIYSIIHTSRIVTGND